MTRGVRGLLCAFACVAACGVDADEAIDPTPRIALNGLAASDLSANTASLPPLATGPLATTAAASRVDGNVLSYVAACALPGGASVTVHGTKYAGTYGLAPAWATRALTATEQRWVSACVLARTNLFGVEVQLSLRGTNPALASTLLEPVEYLIPEGAFYGNLFATGEPAFACSSLLKTATDWDPERACTQSTDGKTTRCGFTYTHGCALLDVNLAPACSGLLPPYGNCKGDGTSYAEVITVFLTTL